VRCLGTKRVSRRPASPKGASSIGGSISSSVQRKREESGGAVQQGNSSTPVAACWSCSHSPWKIECGKMKEKKKMARERPARQKLLRILYKAITPRRAGEAWANERNCRKNCTAQRVTGEDRTQKTGTTDYEDGETAHTPRPLRQSRHGEKPYVSKSLLTPQKEDLLDATRNVKKGLSEVNQSRLRDKGRGGGTERRE